MRLQIVTIWDGKYPIASRVYRTEVSIARGGNDATATCSAGTGWRGIVCTHALEAVANKQYDQ
jgi:hypothetical protein